MNRTQRVLITEASFLTPLGNDWATLMESLRSGRSGVRRLGPEEISADFPAKLAARVEGLDRSDPAALATAAAGRLASELACRLATGLPVDALISGGLNLSAFSLAVEAFSKEGLTSLDGLPHLRREAGALEASRRLAQRDIRIPASRQLQIGNACATGYSAVGMALQRIRRGIWRRALVLAIELDAHLLQTMGLHQLGLLSEGVPLAEGGICGRHPFTAGRDGMVKGEGAALLLLESEEAMRERGGSSLGEILGWGSASEAGGLLDGASTGSGLSTAIGQALTDAGLGPERIGYIQAHGTGTARGDRAEIAALRGCFGKRLAEIPIGSLKHRLGHSTIASGLVELACVLAMIRGGFIGPESWNEEPDPELMGRGLRFVGQQPERLDFEHALLNSSGFGGQSACLVIRRSR